MLFCGLESKFDTNRQLYILNELGELNGCSHIMFFEAKKPQELFIWLSKSASGPSIRFHIQNINTLEELHLKGNCMKNTRPILTFDPFFDKTSHGKIMQELLVSTFGVPEKHRKTRPYIDRVVHFAWADDRIWLRNYQLKEGQVMANDDKTCLEGVTLEEIGPRMILHPIRILEGSFNGRTLWLNPNYVSAGIIRSNLRSGEASKHKQRMINQVVSLTRKSNATIPTNELDHVFD